MAAIPLIFVVTAVLVYRVRLCCWDNERLGLFIASTIMPPLALIVPFMMVGLPFKSTLFSYIPSEYETVTGLLTVITLGLPLLGWLLGLARIDSIRKRWR